MTDKLKAMRTGRSRSMYRLLLTALCALTFVYGVYCVNRFGNPVSDCTPDETNYIAMAERLLNEHVYSFWGDGPDAYVTPGYPLLLTLGMALFGAGAKGLFAIRIMQCAMLTAAVALTARLARLLSGRSLAGLIASGLVAANFSYDYFAVHLLTEVPYVCFLMVFLALFLEAQRRGRLWLHAAAGAAFAAAVLIRPMIFVTLPFWYLVPLLRPRGKRLQVCKAVGWFLIGMAVVFSPWWIRNAEVLHRFVLFGTQTNPMFSGLAENIWQYGLDDPARCAGTSRCCSHSSASGRSKRSAG